MEEDSSPSIPTEKNGTPEQDVANGSLILSKLLLLCRVKMENGRANLDALLKEEMLETIACRVHTISWRGEYD
jgi:hypothetical protein